MNTSLQEILELLQENFPKIESKSLIKIIFTIKARDSQFKKIWFSRYESYKFWIWNDTLQRIIYFLRDFWLLEKTWTKIRNKWVHTCNIYKLSDDFRQLFNELQFFTKKVFEYINPLEFMKKFFSYKFRFWIYTFKVNWQKYLIQTRWAYKDVIYWTVENKIINPLSLL